MMNLDVKPLSNEKSTKKKNIVLVLLAIALIVVPLVIKPQANYEGADGQAEEVINQIAPNYTPWFSSLYEPPSGEIESLLFSIQAALGAGIIGYYIGSKRKK